MFSKFLQNEICVKVMLWLLSHSVGDYDAVVIAYDCEIYDISSFTEVMFILDSLGVINVDQEEDNLRIIFNEDSIIVQSFKTLKECFDNEAYRNSKVCAALSEMHKNMNFSPTNSLQGLEFLSDEEIDDFLYQIKNYKDIEFDDNPVVAERQKTIQDEARRLDEAGELDNFIEFINSQR